MGRESFAWFLLGNTGPPPLRGHGCPQHWCHRVRVSCSLRGRIIYLNLVGTQTLQSVSASLYLLYAPPLHHVTSCCINRFQPPSPYQQPKVRRRKDDPGVSTTARSSVSHMSQSRTQGRRAGVICTVVVMLTVLDCATELHYGPNLAKPQNL